MERGGRSNRRPLLTPLSVAEVFLDTTGHNTREKSVALRCRIELRDLVGAITRTLHRDDQLLGRPSGIVRSNAEIAHNDSGFVG